MGRPKDERLPTVTYLTGAWWENELNRTNRRPYIFDLANCPDLNCCPALYTSLDKFSLYLLIYDLYLLDLDAYKKQTTKTDLHETTTKMQIQHGDTLIQL